MSHVSQNSIKVAEPTTKEQTQILSDLTTKEESSNMSAEKEDNFSMSNQNTEKITESESKESQEQNNTSDENEQNKTVEGGKKKVEFKRETTDDPEAKMIVETFEPIIASTHQDSFIRFWTLDGDLLREISPLTKRQGVAITSLCYDEDVNILVTGDHRGYLTLWDVGAFLEDPESEELELIKQVICWRGHLARVVSLVYIDSLSAIVSGSVDGSVRVWWGRKGRFVGFFNQHRPFTFPVSEETSGTPVLPYDISEVPVVPTARKKSATQRIRPVQKFEYPLIFDQERWQPFRRSAYVAKKKTVEDPKDKKFFKALVKPKAYNHHLNSSVTGEKKQGAVFRALPVYRVMTPKRPKTPLMRYSFTEEEEGNFMNAGGGRGTRSLGKSTDKPPGRTPSPNKMRGKSVVSRTSLAPLSRFSHSTINSLSSSPRRSRITLVDRSEGIMSCD